MSSECHFDSYDPNSSCAAATTAGMEQILRETREEFPSCKNILHDELTKGEVMHSISCLSLHLKHNTGMDYPKGRKLVPFLEFTASERMKVLGRKRELDAEQAWSMVSSESLHKQTKRTFLRAVENLNEKASQRILESEQILEDCIRYLNAEGQYAVLLHSNEELVVPGAGSKHCPLQTFCSPVPATVTHYWDELKGKDPGSEKKSILSQHFNIQYLS